MMRITNGWIKFNAWSKDAPLDSENTRIFVNAGIGKQKFNAYCPNAKPINRFGKLPDSATLSKGTERAISEFFNQVEPDFKVGEEKLTKHSEAVIETWLGDFCITDIANVMGVNVGEDGMFLVKLENGFAKIWNCGKFHNIAL